MLALLELGEHSGLLALALEATQRVLETLFLADVDDRHC
jgi:hypothetical protein